MRTLDAARVSPFTYADPFVDVRRPHVDDFVSELAAMGFHGRAEIDLARKRRSVIDFSNPATRRLMDAVPGMREWLGLVPTAAALEACYLPCQGQLPDGTRVGAGFISLLSNVLDARGIRSRAAVLTAQAIHHAAATDREQRWLSLACGAAHPMVKAAATVRALGLPEPDTTLVDLDRRSLQLAQRHARTAQLNRLTAVRGNVLHRDGVAGPRFASTGSTVTRDYDLVEAIGLLEYLGLDDWEYRYGSVIRTKQKLAGARTFLRNAYDLVRPGGLLVVSNMLDSHPQLGFTLNVVQWPHIQPRSIPLMLAVLTDAGVEGRIEVVVPEDGVYAVYAIRKPA